MLVTIMVSLVRTGLLFLFLAGCAPAAELAAVPEYLRPDPFGGIVQADGPGKPQPALALTGARAGYVSAHLVARVPEGGAYAVVVSVDGLEADLYREWFHFADADKRYYPDALVPVRGVYRSRMPEPDNRVPRQTAQAFWLDVWIPAEAAPGAHRGSARLEAAGKTMELPIEITVVPAAGPAEDVVSMDHNSYGTSWMGAGDVFRAIHRYHRIFYEHRGVFHQLGYGHAGKVAPEFAPALAGSGRNRRIVSWELFDRHYGPLLDGSAFAGTRRGPRPIPFVYLPVNPEWPASFLWWGEPGYEAEFVNVLSAMERHFREKGWTGTRFELFFNHKKRYKGFPWDGDETRFPNDLPYYREYARLLRKAVPADTPVKFVFRADSSWMMERQFRELAGIVNFWVCGGTEFSWHREWARRLKERGDIVWTYGGTPVLSEVPSEMSLAPLRAWMFGIDGYVHWLSVAPGPDPWFHSDGGGTALVYPGARFGVEGPIPSVRLKLERNTVQDLALLASYGGRRGMDALRAEAARRFNGTRPDDWWTPRPPVADRPAEELSNADISEAPEPNRKYFSHLSPAAWQNVRDYIMELAKERP